LVVVLVKKIDAVQKICAAGRETSKRAELKAENMEKQMN